MLGRKALKVSDHALLWIIIPVLSKGSEDICEKPVKTSDIRVEIRVETRRMLADRP
jgi:hypothetical protein